MLPWNYNVNNAFDLITIFHFILYFILVVHLGKSFAILIPKR